jgi:hypothetical protein
MEEKIWYTDLAGFFSLDRYYIILPIQNMTLEEKLNAIVRFFAYLGILMALLKGNAKYLFFGIIAAGVSIVIYQNEQQSRVAAEKFLEATNRTIVDNKVCVRSTVDNPFMNPSLLDITENPDRPAACSLENPVVQETVETNFNERLFSDVSDLYGNMSSQRQFYAMPSTTIPNDQTGFAEWCFGRGRTCKEGNGDQCFDNTYRHIANK